MYVCVYIYIYIHTYILLHNFQDHTISPSWKISLIARDPVIRLAPKRSILGMSTTCHMKVML
jgi:hypothetical protein